MLDGGDDEDSDGGVEGFDTSQEYEYEIDTIELPGGRPGQEICSVEWVHSRL